MAPAIAALQANRHNLLFQLDSGCGEAPPPPPHPSRRGSFRRVCVGSFWAASSFFPGGRLSFLLRLPAISDLCFGRMSPHLGIGEVTAASVALGGGTQGTRRSYKQTDSRLLPTSVAESFQSHAGPGEHPSRLRGVAPATICPGAFVFRVATLSRRHRPRRPRGSPILGRKSRLPAWDRISVSGSPPRMSHDRSCWLI